MIRDNVFVARQYVRKASGLVKASDPFASLIRRQYGHIMGIDRPPLDGKRGRTVAELNDRWDEVNPELTLVIADYDKETALKAKFGVTYQDTFVLLDAAGAGTEFWNAGGVDGLNMYTLD